MPRYEWDHNFLSDLSHSHYRFCLAFRHILGITGRPLCNDPIHYTHKLCTITYPDMQCSHPQCLDHVSGPIPWGLGPPLVVLGPPSRQTLGWITALLHPSSVHHLLLTSVLVSCIGFIHVVKSRPFSSISSWRLTLLTASAMQPPCLECTWFQNHRVVL